MMNLTKQHVAALLLAYAALVTLKCPCKRLNGCHKKEFLLSVGGASALVLHDWCG